MTPNFEHIPDCLKHQNQWLLWRYKNKNGSKPTKVPCQSNGNYARTNDSSTWTTFEEVKVAYESGGFDGIGYVFIENEDELVGIDLDSCIKEGKFEPWAKNILEQFNTTYAEVSPSGTGIHIICKGTPLCTGQKQWKDPKYEKDAAIEIYNEGRYFCFTGNSIGINEIVDCQPGLEWLYQEYFAEEHEEPNYAHTPNGDVNLDCLVKALEYIPADNYTQWIKVGMALKTAGVDLQVWNEWSKKSSKYKPGICATKWPTFKSRENNKVTFGTIFHIAKQHGFKSLRDWSEIEPFSIGTITQPDYPTEALGTIAAAAATRIMEVVECPKAMAGASVFGAINTCCQPYWDLEIDGRIQPITIHQLEVGESGIRKSATDDQTHKSIRQEQKTRREEYRTEYADYLDRLEVYNAERKAILKGKKSRQDKELALKNLVKPVPPINPILLVSDPTIQGIEKSWQNGGYPATALNTTEGGRLLGSHSFKEENMIHTAASFSLYYDGVPVDRMRGGDGVAVIYGKRLSINIMVQPILARQLYANKELIDQGWLSRVAPTLCEGKEKVYNQINLTQDESMNIFWDKCTLWLDKPLLVEENTNNLVPNRIGHGTEAKQLYIKFHNHIQKLIQPGEILHLVRGLGEKSHDMASRFASNIEVFQNPNATEISLQSMKSGICIMTFHLIEALRLRESTPDAGVENQCYQLWCWLKRHANKGKSEFITVRNICQSGPTEFRNSQLARRLMFRLQDDHRLVRLHSQEPEVWQIRALTADEERLLTDKTKIEPKSIFDIDGAVAECSRNVATEEAQLDEIVAKVASVAVFPGATKQVEKLSEAYCMGTLLTKLNKKNIQITLIGNTNLDVVAPDELWDNGLEDYLAEHKQQLISELSQNSHLAATQEEIENTEPQKPATIATKCMNSAVPVATRLLQVATTALNTNMQQDATIALQPTAPTLDLTKQADQKLNCIFIDFETRSEADLDKVGSILYSEHKSTDILCLAILDASSNDKPVVLTNEDIKTGRKIITDLVENKNNIFVAHNAAFDQAIWTNVMVKKYGYPEIPIERWRCTMAKAYAHGLPGSLKDAAKALNLPIQKDMEGNAKMLTLSKPKKGGGFWTPDEKPEMFENLYSYCKTDIEVTKLIDSRLPDLIDREQELWFIDQRMNQTGINIDLDMVKKANILIDNHKVALEKRLQEITGGEVSKPTERQKLLSWLKTRGIELENTQEVTIVKTLKNNNLPAEVREVLLIHQEGKKSSLAKYKTMLDRADSNAQIRGDLLQYHGSHTGRWAGRGIQLHNFPRTEIDLKDSCKDISTLEYDDFSAKYGTDVSEVISQSLRDTLIPSEGKTFYIGDYAQMEARITAWLAGEQETLDAYARGEDLYCIEASRIYNRDITKRDKEERKIGKVAVLALGFGGGIGAFANMARLYGTRLESAYDNLWTTTAEEEKDKANWSVKRYLKATNAPISEKEALIADVIKQRWRANNPNVVKFWSKQEHAAITAVMDGQSESNGLFWFRENEFLYCKLPGGRCIAYPYPAVNEDSNSKCTLSYQSTKGREETWGGTLAENVIQAVQRDLLVDVILRLEDSPYKVIFHVHDEIVAEGEPGLDLAEFKSLMRQVPPWASGLPIDVDARISDRFGK